MIDSDFPLQNPRAEDLSQPDQKLKQDTNLVVSPPRYQLDLGIELTLKQKIALWVGDLKERAKKREIELEHIPFWQYFSPPFAVTTAVAVVLTTAIIGILKFNTVPTIPFYYNALEARWEKEDGVLLLLIPLGLAVIQVLIVRSIRKIFSFDRRLSYMLSWCQAIINILILVAAVQIYSLIN